MRVLSSRRSSGTVSAMSWPVPTAGPPYLWRDPRGNRFILGPRPAAGDHAGSLPLSRWSPPRTNDLDRGEDRRIVAAAEEAVGGVRSRAAPCPARRPVGRRGSGKVRGRPALSRCTQRLVLAAAT